MGMTGAGKSTFISRLKMSDSQVHIGHGLESSKHPPPLPPKCAQGSAGHH